MTTPEHVIQFYTNAGLGILLPLPKNKKFPPPSGYTGIEAEYADQAQAGRWLAAGAYGNYALRVPDGVLGIDFDARKGGTVHPWLEGLLARAPRSTSRGSADPSGVYFVRVPPDMLPEIRDWHLAEFGTEAVRPQHRYAVVWPSTHPDTKQIYLWYTPGDTDPHPGPPHIDTFPVVERDELREAMEKAARARRSDYTPSSATFNPQRTVEPHELKSLKALVAGYAPYDEAPTPAMSALRATYEAKKIKEITDDLDDLTAGADAWEPSIGVMALRLYSIALAPWTALSPETAHDLIVKHGPTCEKAVNLGVHGHSGPCWDENDLARRSERALSQHDGGWAKLPGNLRGKAAPGEKQPKDAQLSEGAQRPKDAQRLKDAQQPRKPKGPDVSGGSGGSDGDDFFDDPVDEDAENELIWLTRDLPLEDPPEPMALDFCFRGMFSIFSGPPGSGKSTIASLLCCDYKTLWCSSEEARGTIHARALILENENIAVPSQMVTIADLPKIERWLEENPDIELIILDNLHAFGQLGEFGYNAEVVKTMMLPLLSVLMKHHVACLGLSHPTKAQTSVVGGSDAWMQLARHVVLAKSVYQSDDGAFQVERDDAKQHFIYVTVEKSNYPYRNSQLFRSSKELVPVKTESGKEVFDWLAISVEEAGMVRAAGAAVSGAAAGTRLAKNTPKQEVPDIQDPEALLTGKWVEIDQIAEKAGISVTKIVPALAKYDLIATRGAAGKLLFITRVGDPLERISVAPGEYEVENLMAETKVTAQVHMLWLLTDQGLHAEIQGEQVIISRPQHDETEAALNEAGLGDLG